MNETYKWLYDYYALPLMKVGKQADALKERIVSHGSPADALFLWDRLEDLCRRMKVRIGIITVPGEHAQAVCSLLIKSGILAVWNFSNVHLDVPEGILVQNENMAVPLAILSNHLKERFSTK